VPVGWTIPAVSASKSWWGVEILELHFVNIYGAPISLQLHPDHVTVALQGGGCNTVATTSPGCMYRSNADAPPGCPASSTVVCMRGYYAIPPGALVQGKWNEIMMHVHWAADSTGEFETWFRTSGSTGWTESSAMNGVPTVQWNNSLGCCGPSTYNDHTEAYTPALSAPLSVWLDNDLAGTGFRSVAGTMP
jgi:hypothetical protein